jgi:GABA permease
MRNPVRSEADAFYIAYGGAVLIGASVALGVLVDPLVGLALFAGGLIGAFVWEISTKDPDRRRPLREAASQGRRAAPPARRRVLVVANRTLQGEELRAELRGRAAGGAELRVVTPILASRAHYIASDVDKELEEARERLAAALAWAQTEGLDATGKVGDPNAALGAIEDELRLFGADEVIISTHPPGKSNWLETGIVERLREELDIPVTHVIVDLERASVAPGH